MNKTLVVWDRMGDYHRIRIETYRNLFKNDLLITADLGATDGLYHWENTQDEKHYFLSEFPAENKDIRKRFIRFKKIIKENQVEKVILAGYGKPEYLFFTLWLKNVGIKCYYFAESWYPGKNFSDWVKGKFIKNFTNGVFASGKRAKDHFSSRLGYPSKKIQTGYSVVDNDHFYYERSFNEVKFNFEHKPVLLCIARHSPEKNLKTLIQSFQNSDLFEKWNLKIVGGGPSTEALRNEINDFSKVELLGWKSYSELPELYKQASCFILPSKFEPWGLVVNEAMAASLPIIMSNECGCVPELYSDNGYLFDAENEQFLVEKLNQLNKNTPEELFLMGQNSHEQIKKFTPVTWAENLYQLIH